MRCMLHKGSNMKKRSDLRRLIQLSRNQGNPWLILLMLVILLNTVTVLAMVMVPRMIVVMIQESGGSMLRIIVVVCSLELLLLLLKLGSVILSGKAKNCSEELFRESYARLALKQSQIPYGQSLSGENLKLLEGGKYGIWEIPPLSGDLEKLGSSIATVLLNAVLICFFDWKLLIIPLAVLLLLRPAYRALTRIELDNAKRLLPENRAFGWYCRLVSDIRFGEDLRIYQAKALITKRCRSLMQRIYKINQKSFTKKGILLGIIKFLFQLQIVAAALILGIRCMKGMAIADFVLLFSAICAVSAASNDLMEGRNRMKKVDALLAPFFKFISQEDESAGDSVTHEQQTEAQQAEGHEVSKGYPTAHDLRIKQQRAEGPGMDMVSFENVTFTYPGQVRPALSNVSFHISAGEKVGIVGTNGAGKSTVVKLLSRLYPLQSGRITIDGVDISKLSVKEHREKISVLYQDFQLLPVKLVENIASRGAEELTPEDTDRIRSFFCDEKLWSWLMSLPDKEDTYISPSLSKRFVTPSGGQSQYLAVMRAAYRQSSIYVFDEPTMALDIEVEKSVMQMLETLHKESTCIMISHRLSHTKLMNQVIVMDEGKLVERGTHEELLRRDGLYRKMYTKQALKYGVKGAW